MDTATKRFFQVSGGIVMSAALMAAVQNFVFTQSSFNPERLKPEFRDACVTSLAHKKSKQVNDDIVITQNEIKRCVSSTLSAAFLQNEKEKMQSFGFLVGFLGLAAIGGCCLIPEASSKKLRAIGNRLLSSSDDPTKPLGLSLD